jgi:signal transduction histidine kinase
VLNDLLAFEKLAAGMCTVDKTHIALLPFLKDCAKMFLVSAQAKDIAIEFVLEGMAAPSPLSVRGGPGSTGSCGRQLVVDIDRVKMKTVFRNLFSNAIKFSPQGGRITVTLTFQDPATAGVGAVGVAVAGAGMAGVGAVSSRAAGAGLALGVPGVPVVAEGQQVLVSVKDSGPGMTAENLCMLFGEGVQFNANTLQVCGTL